MDDFIPCPAPAAGKRPHLPVMPGECISSLNIRADGTYVDCTSGYGGHSGLILSELSDNGHLICFDRDPAAIAYLREKFGGHANVTIVHTNFASIRGVLAGLNIPPVDGILADLGLSSVQIDTAQRGFSYNTTDAPLDMRMSQSGRTAADILNEESEQEIAKILYLFGEEKFSRQIARRVVETRQTRPYTTTGEFADTIRASIPAKARREGGNPCKRSFQALRCAVNNELTDLPGAIEDMFGVLAPGGVLSVLSFQSLEDRIIKQKFNELSNKPKCVCPDYLPYCVCAAANATPEGELKKPLTPSKEELEANPRSHSARLRTIIKL